MPDILPGYRVIALEAMWAVLDDPGPSRVFVWRGEGTGAEILLSEIRGILNRAGTNIWERK